MFFLFFFLGIALKLRCARVLSRSYARETPIRHAHIRHNNNLRFEVRRRGTERQKRVTSAHSGAVDAADTPHAIEKKTTTLRSF